LRARDALLVMVVLTGLTLCPPDARAAAAPGSSNLRVLPNELHIRETFQGAPLAISADVPKGAGAIVEIRGETHEGHLLRQGRRGVLWMSVGEVAVQGAPSVYLLLAASDLASHSDEGVQWGYEALRKQIKFIGSIPGGGTRVLFDQFVKLKESEGLYGVFPESLKPVHVSNGRETVEGRIMLPSNIAPGNYNIVLSVYNSGKLLEQSSVELPVEMKGLPFFLASLAYQHALLYGLVAVVIAILTGFVMGFVFKGKSAH
jgi:hypothetical protein